MAGSENSSNTMFHFCIVSLKFNVKYISAGKNYVKNVVSKGINVNTQVSVISNAALMEQS